MITFMATATLSSSEPSRWQKRRAAWFWGSLIIGLLSTQVIIGFGSIYIALGDPSVAVVPDYHEKALLWDQHREARIASQSLGWTVTTRIGRSADLRGDRSVVVLLSGRDGIPIEASEVSLRYYHHARGNDVKTCVLQPQGAGTYLAQTPMRRDGIWQMLLTVKGDAVLSAFRESGDASASQYVQDQSVRIGPGSDEATRWKR
ncbi:MAG: FixH family protein [Planctomycetota bacterium]